LALLLRFSGGSWRIKDGLCGVGRGGGEAVVINSPFVEKFEVYFESTIYHSRTRKR